MTTEQGNFKKVSSNPEQEIFEKYRISKLCIAPRSEKQKNSLIQLDDALKSAIHKAYEAGLEKGAPTAYDSAYWKGKEEAAQAIFGELSSKMILISRPDKHMIPEACMSLTKLEYQALKAKYLKVK